MAWTFALKKLDDDPRFSLLVFFIYICLLEKVNASKNYKAIKFLWVQTIIYFCQYCDNTLICLLNNCAADFQGKITYLHVLCWRKSVDLKCYLLPMLQFMRNEVAWYSSLNLRLMSKFSIRIRMLILTKYRM